MLPTGRNLYTVDPRAVPSRAAYAQAAERVARSGLEVTPERLAGALALALARGGRKVLLLEVENRQGLAQLFDTAPLPASDWRRLRSSPARATSLRAKKPSNRIWFSCTPARVWVKSICEVPGRFCHSRPTPASTGTDRCRGQST